MISFSTFFGQFKSFQGGREMPQGLGVMDALAEDPSLVPSTHFSQITTIYKTHSRRTQHFWPPQSSALTCTYVHSRALTCTHTHLMIKHSFLSVSVSRRIAIQLQLCKLYKYPISQKGVMVPFFSSNSILGMLSLVL